LCAGTDPTIPVLRRFLPRAQSLSHPNIIQYLDSFISGTELIIVFEWAAAGDLKRQIRKAQERNTYFDERVCWKYFSQICDAINYMHEQRVMHR